MRRAAYRQAKAQLSTHWPPVSVQVWRNFLSPSDTWVPLVFAALFLLGAVVFGILTFILDASAVDPTSAYLLAPQTLTLAAASTAALTSAAFAVRGFGRAKYYYPTAAAVWIQHAPAAISLLGTFFLLIISPFYMQWPPFIVNIVTVLVIVSNIWSVFVVELVYRWVAGAAVDLGRTHPTTRPSIDWFFHREELYSAALGPRRLIGPNARTRLSTMRQG